MELRGAASRAISPFMTHRATRRPRTFPKPPHWSDAPPPAPAKEADAEELGPTRYGDWVRKGIAIDF